MAWTYLTGSFNHAAAADAGPALAAVFDLLDQAPSLQRLDVEGQLDPATITTRPASEADARALGYGMWELKDPTSGHRRQVYAAVGCGWGTATAYWYLPIVQFGGVLPESGAALPAPERDMALGRASVGGLHNLHLVDDGSGAHLVAASASASGMYGWVFHLSWEREWGNPAEVPASPCVYAMDASPSAATVAAGDYPLCALPDTPGNPLVRQTCSPLHMPCARIASGGSSGTLYGSGLAPVAEDGLVVASPLVGWAEPRGMWADPLCAGFPPGCGNRVVDGVRYIYPWSVPSGAGIFAQTASSPSGTTANSLPGLRVGESLCLGPVGDA